VSIHGAFQVDDKVFTVPASRHDFALRGFVGLRISHPASFAIFAFLIGVLISLSG